MSLEDLGDDITDLMNEGYSFMNFPTKYFNFDRKLKITMDDIDDVYLFKRKDDDYIIFELYGGYLMIKTKLEMPKSLNLFKNYSRFLFNL